MPRPSHFAILVGIVLAVPAARSRGDDAGSEFVRKALSREIIGAKQTLADVALYCEERIPGMPPVKSVAEWERAADRMRTEALDQVIFRGEAAAWRMGDTKVEWLETIEGLPGYKIKKLRYEALPGLWIPALLYTPETLTGKVPVVLNVNGHDGKGKAADYKQIRCINQAKRGMIALNTEWFGMGQFRDGNYRHDLIDHIDLCGTSGIATHYLAMKRGLDLLLSLEHSDPERVAVTGLSGGGWQTIFISAFDTRVTLTNPVAGYSSFRTRARHFSDLGDSEQTPCDLGTVTDYAQMTAMMAPRGALLTFNAADDCCFASGHALPPLMDAAWPVYKLYNKLGSLRAHINTEPGTHNYGLDNRQAFYTFVGDLFFKGDAHFATKEIPSESEVKTEEALRVALPADNASLHSLALGLSKRLPRDAELPDTKDGARSWRDARRGKLRDLVRAKRFETHAAKLAVEQYGLTRATFWRLRAADWSVPVVEIVRGEPRKTVLLVGDDGRKAEGKRVEELLENGSRVLAVDPFYVGESKVAERDFLFALLLSTIGDRPLGLQASELSAVARWTKSEHDSEPLTLFASGRRTGTMALAAAALEEQAIDEVVVNAPLGSLKELIEAKTPYADCPELFCFGLLQTLDVVQLAALAAPRHVSFLNTSDRAKKELASLKAWYMTWGVEHDPLKP